MPQHTMSLNLSQLNQQVAEMGQALAARADAQRDRTALACKRLRDYAEAYDRLRAQVGRTRTRGSRHELGWVGAYPPETPFCTPLDRGIDLPACPAAATLVATDGSQILPDRHAALPYYLINAGTLVLHHGSGAAPACVVTPELHYLDDDVYVEGELVPGGQVNARRDLLMMHELARLASADGAPPVVAVADGPLLLWGYQETLPGARRRAEEHIRAYLEALTRLRRAGAHPAGYIDRPSNRGVIHLLYLATLEEVTPETLSGFDLEGVRDQDVFEQVLESGQRSALFVTQSHINKTYAERGHEIWFFYLNVAARPPAAEPPALARVEVPAWVAQDGAALDTVHALLYHQCQVLGRPRYPYALTRADELARIDPGDKHQVDQLIERVLLQHDLPARRSAKEQSKQLTRSHPRRKRR